MYTLLVRIGGLFLFFKGLFDDKTKEWNKVRKEQLSNLNLTNPVKSDAPCIWVHCASAGEYQQILPVIDLIKDRLPQYQILLTFFSPSGYQQVQNAETDHILYLPLDIKVNMDKIIRHFNPKLFIGVKYEWWWNLFERLNHFRVPKILVAVRFDKTHYIFRWYSSRFRKILSQNTIMLCQDDTTRIAASSLNIFRISVCGDPRVDTVLQRKSLSRPLPDSLTNLIPSDKPVIIYASIYAEDLPLIKHTIGQYPNHFHLIVPHKTDKNTVLEVSKYLAVTHFYIQATAGQKPQNALIIDTTGMLFDMYKLASFCYVGGGFTHNVHNTLEPAVHNLPICIGPKHRNFPEIDYFKSHQLIHIAYQPSTFSTFISQLTSNDINKIKDGFEAYFDQNKGGGGKIFEVVKEVLEE